MPVIFIEAPPGIRPEAKQKLMEKITMAVDEAYHIGADLPSRVSGGECGDGRPPAVREPENP